MSSLYSAADEAMARKKKRVYNTASSSAFSSTLSSLLSSTDKSTEPPSSTSLPQPSKPTPRTRHSKDAPLKENIFTSRAKTASASFTTDKDALGQKHSTASPALDSDDYARSKRKMEEKARLYAAMKRGDYVPNPNGMDHEADGLIDFDRKWAQQSGANAAHSPTHSSTGYSSNEDQLESETVTYTDEFGRTRQGTTHQVRHLLRRQQASAHASAQLAQMSARPAPESEIITGDTIQAGAFNPSTAIQDAMASLARKRDRSLTPPEAVHYDSKSEIREKGVGFYHFSVGDEARRNEELEGLQRERERTERIKKEREQERERKARKKNDEDGQAERFLRGLEGEMLSSATTGGPRTAFVQESKPEDD